MLLMIFVWSVFHSCYLSFTIKYILYPVHDKRSTCMPKLRAFNSYAYKYIITSQRTCSLLPIESYNFQTMDCMNLSPNVWTGLHTKYVSISKLSWDHTWLQGRRWAKVAWLFWIFFFFFLACFNMKHLFSFEHVKMQVQGVSY